MNQQKFNSLIISDFNTGVLAGYLNNDTTPPITNTTAAPFGQVIPTLIGKDLDCWKNTYDSAIIWTQPENVIESFKHILNYQPIPVDKILREVDEYTLALMNLRDKVNSVFIPTWILPTYHRGYGMLEMKNGIGITNILARMNLKLSENLNNTRNFYLLNTRKWIESVGKNAFTPKLWYMGKIPFSNEVFKEAMKDIKLALGSLTGNSKKLIILDLDNTLWGGIAGEIGQKNIRLGGHDPEGEAFVDFQKTLKAFINRGILLGIVSKNEEHTALETINTHPEMILRLNSFAGWKINWDDKAKNIVDLVSDLNLGLQSVVFIDDNPVERARVKEALPEVLVPQWPQDKMLYKKALLSLSCFDAPLISKEDSQRTKMYAIKRQSDNLKTKIPSLDDWLKTLEIKVKIEKLTDTNLQRIIQLLNKTNQMNLATRRITESELVNWIKNNTLRLWAFRVSDKFGDSGLTGIISLENKDKTGWIKDFVLSCRVIGRKIEETMLYTVFTQAKSLELDELKAKYIPTTKNSPCLQFWKKSGFNHSKKENLFTWKTKNTYPKPENIQIEGELYE
jgi:FkbH-like protein